MKIREIISELAPVQSLGAPVNPTQGTVVGSNAMTPQQQSAEKAARIAKGMKDINMQIAQQDEIIKKAQQTKAELNKQKSSVR